MSAGTRGAAWKAPRKVGVPLSERDAPVIAMAVSSDGHYGGLLRGDGWVEQVDLEAGVTVVEGWHAGAVALALSPSALVTVDGQEAGWWTRRAAAPDTRVAHGLTRVDGAASVDLGAHVVVWGSGRWGTWRTLTKRPVASGAYNGVADAGLGHAWAWDGATVVRLAGAGPVPCGAAPRGMAAARAWLVGADGGWTVDGRPFPGPSLAAWVTPGVDVLWALHDGVLTRWSAAGRTTVADGIVGVRPHPSDRYALVVDARGAVSLLDAEPGA